MRESYLKQLPLLTIVLCFSSCWAPSAVFNQRAYEQATDLKVDALSLMHEATRDYDSASTEIENVKLEFRKAYEYAKGLPDNDETAKQYQLMMDPKEHSLFGFLEIWKTDGRLDSVFVADAMDEVTRHFDDIIALESGKRK